MFWPGRARVGLFLAKALFSPGISVDVISIALPEPRHFMVQKLQRAQPLDRLPRIKMGHNQPDGKPMIGRERLAVVMCGEQYFLAIQVRERDISRVSLLAMHEHLSRIRLRRTRRRISRIATPSQRLSNRLQRVTQWKSLARWTWVKR